MDEHFPFRSTFDFDGWFHRGHGNIRDDSLMTPPFALWRPPEFLVEGVEELAEWETAMEKFEIKDVEFKEDRV